MERLTYFDDFGEPRFKIGNTEYRNEVSRRLAYYEDLEEQGRLVVLPCKVGDAIYRRYDDCDFPGDCGTSRMCNGCEYRNVFVEEQSFCISMLRQNGTLRHPYYLTREEAEAALRGGNTE